MPSSAFSSSATHGSLLARVVERDQPAWCQLVDLYGPLIASWCRQCGLDAHATADVMQEVFLAVSTKIGSFRSAAGGGAFRGWLWSVTRSKVVDRFRQQQRAVAGVGGSTAAQRIQLIADPTAIPDGEPTDELSLHQLTRRALEQVRSEFQPQTWQAFWRTVVDGLSTEAVAKEMGVSCAAVRQSRSRILRRLRIHLDVG
jgi:RNA polymerase sigma-70 factor, ECF subfamily